MGFSKPSVSRTMRVLREGGYVTADENGGLQLTKAGLARAQKIYERHKLLSAYLQKLGGSEENAIEDACKMEHYISDETFEAIKRHVKQFGSVDSAK